ncbi:MAG: hypothetical protein ACI9QC_000827 [Oceanicoccus sp.]|jgi:hypothetical protein
MKKFMQILLATFGILALSFAGCNSADEDGEMMEEEEEMMEEEAMEEAMEEEVVEEDAE